MHTPCVYSLPAVAIVHLKCHSQIPCLPHSTELCPDVYPDHDCRPSHGKTVEDPPLLFDLDRDPSEVYTLTPVDPEYNQTISIIYKVSL